MNALPDWLTRDTPVWHKPTRQAFLPVSHRRYKEEHRIYLVDLAGEEHPLDECDRLSSNAIQTGAMELVTATGILSLMPAPNAIIVTDGQRRTKVELPDADDETLAAALLLAEFFNGKVISGGDIDGY